MTEPTTPVKRFQWKWVGMTVFFYVLFYVLPIVVFASVVHGRIADILISIWSFAGIIIVAAVVGYLSEGVTIWEPAVGAALLTAIACVVAAIELIRSSVGHRLSVFHLILPFIILVPFAFALSLFGAWFGERAQKLWKKKTPEEIPNVG
jgi:lysylphosphatidylglycerol synthetase-like protein (DUF2156 family)